MTLEERIERAARADYENWRQYSSAASTPEWDRLTAMQRGRFMTAAEARLRAAVPELFTDPPTHWLAPMEPTPEMIEAYWTSESHGPTSFDPEAEYADMRKAYTSKDTAE